jgi:hypothetical protein
MEKHLLHKKIGEAIIEATANQGHVREPLTIQKLLPHANLK